MKALLIDPHKLIPRSFNLNRRPAPALGLAYIAGTVEQQGFDTKVFDCVAEDPDSLFPLDGYDDILVQGIPFDKMLHRLDTHYDLIGIGLMFSNNWLINRKLISRLKEKYPNAWIVAGGEHASGLPDYILADCEGLDMVVSGEGEDAMSEICRKMKAGESLYDIPGTTVKIRKEGNRIHTNIKKKRILEIQDIAEPAWHLFPVDKYFSLNISYGVSAGLSLPMLATRGCPYSCTFCSSPQMWGTKYLMRETDSVINEIKKLNRQYGVTNIDFMDLTTVIKRDWIVTFCKRLIEENMGITWQLVSGTRTEAIDYEVATLLRESGCVYVTYAPEFGSEKMLKATKKKLKSPNILKSIYDSHRANMLIKLNMMLGMPDETLGDILKTYWFLIKASFYGASDATPAIFNAYPGSALFQELRDNKELVVNDEYFKDMVYTQSFHGFKNYNRNLSKKTMVALLWGGYLVFYASNFLFRPWRAIQALFHIASGKYKTLGEASIGNLLKRKKQYKNVPQPNILEQKPIAA